MGGRGAQNIQGAVAPFHPPLNETLHPHPTMDGFKRKCNPPPKSKHLPTPMLFRWFKETMLIAGGKFVA